MSAFHPFKAPFVYSNMEGCPVIRDSDGNLVLNVRGWGQLTGAGALNLSWIEAELIQDRIGQRIAELMNLDCGKGLP